MKQSSTQVNYESIKGSVAVLTHIKNKIISN